MRRLGAAQRWPRWIVLREASDDEPAIEGLFSRPTKGMKRRASREAAKHLGLDPDDADRDILDMADAGDAYSVEMIRLGLKDWKGIGDDDGNELPISPEAIELFLAEEELFDAADEKYVMPEVLRDAEKNGLSASPNGTGEAETRGKNTASSRASRKTASGAKGATTPSSRRKARKAKRSGT